MVPAQSDHDWNVLSHDISLERLFRSMYDAPRDGVLTWTVLCWTLLAFILTGIAGIIIDRLVYRGFREENASPQVMMMPH